MAQLVKSLGLLDATTLVMGSMIGSGVFIVAADISRQVQSPGLLTATWLVTAAITIIAALSYGELAAAMPRAGGQYVFLREAYGRAIGFVFGWSTLLVIQTGTIAAVAVAFAKFFGVFWPQVSDRVYLFQPLHFGRSGYAVALTTQQAVAIVLILGLTWINTRGLRSGKIIQNVFTFTKTAALLGLIVLGVFHAKNPAAAAWSSPGCLVSSLQRRASVARISPRGTTMSTMPWLFRYSARWKPSGSFSRMVCSITRWPAKPISAPGSASWTSPSIA